MQQPTLIKSLTARPSGPLALSSHQIYRPLFSAGTPVPVQSKLLLARASLPTNMDTEEQVLQNTEETQPTQTHFSFGTELPGTENRELGESLTNVLSHLTPPTSSAASPHIHAVVCNSQTCTRNSIINTSHHMGHSQPTLNNQPQVPQPTQNLFDRDTSPLLSREEEIPKNSNQPAREDDDPQIINMLQQMS